MTIAAGSTIRADDFINNSQRNGTPANDAGRVPKLESDAKIHRNFLRSETEGTVGTTHSLTTTAEQRVMVFAKGWIQGISGDCTVTLKYNTTVKDTIIARSNGGVSDKEAFSLMYTETPGAATQNLTVVTTGGTLTDVVILVLKL